MLECPDAFVRSWVQGRYGRGPARGGGADLVGSSTACGGRNRPRRPVDSRPEAGQTGPDPAPAAPAEPVGLRQLRGRSGQRAGARGRAGGGSRRVGTLQPAGARRAPGVGKTHLCEAIRAGPTRAWSTAPARSSRRRSPRGSARTACRPCASATGARANLLILEDVQFLRARSATQVELFHTLDHLLARGRPVVLTATAPPAEIDGLDPGWPRAWARGWWPTSVPPRPRRAARSCAARPPAGGVRVPEECLEAAGRAAGRERARPDRGPEPGRGARRAAQAARSPRRWCARRLATVTVPGRRHTLGDIIELVARPTRSRSRSCAAARASATLRGRASSPCTCAAATRTPRSRRSAARSARDHTSVLYAIDVVERRAVEHPPLRYQLEALSRQAVSASPEPAFSVPLLAGPRRSGARRTRGTRRT